MRRITVSVLTVLIALPAFGDARLPVVNLTAGSVSARAAFGEDVPVKEIKSVAASSEKIAPTRVAATKKSDVKTNASAEKKNVVARAATRQAAPQKDSGEQIVATTDVLSPRRPSADLWAKSDAPLRLPNPSEFKVVRADYDLPEESLDSTARVAVASQSVSAPAQNASARPMNEIDAQIAKLVELQRKADESVKSAAAQNPTRVIAAPIAQTAQTAQSLQSASQPEKIASRAASVSSDNTTDEVKLSRMVVPMAPEVVVRTVEKNTSPRIASVRDDMTKMTPSELRKAFRKTFLSENKHLSTFQMDDRFDVASDMSASMEGFTAKRDLSETGGIRPLEIKIRFRNDDSALSRDNYNLLTEYASIVVSNPKRAIQVSIPQNATRNMDDRKLAARRLAIVEQVLRDTGVSEQRIMPVLSQRDEEGFVLRIISSDQYESLTQKQRDIFGDTVSKKTYKSMSW